MAKSYQEIMSEARAAVPGASPDEVKAQLAAGKPVALLDVREREEFRDRKIGAGETRPQGELWTTTRMLPMTRDELLEILGGGRKEILKTLKGHDRSLMNTDTGEICRLLGEIVRNPGTIRIKLDGPQKPLEWKNWQRRAERNKMFVEGKPVYWIEISHDNGRIYDIYEPVA